jgi:hypothetical protein
MVGVAVAAFSPAPIVLGAIGCGTSATQSLVIRNNGTGVLGISATTTGSAFNSAPVFSVTPGSLSIAHGKSGVLTITATIPPNASAAAALAGSLHLFTTDPNNANVAVPLSAASSGATVVVQQATIDGSGKVTAADFPATKMGTAAAPIDFWLANNGNAPETLTLSTPTAGTGFSVDQIPDGGATITLDQYQTWKGTVRFTPSTDNATANVNVSVVTGNVCASGTALTKLEFLGHGTFGSVTNYPAGVVFPAAPCGGDAPAPQTFPLINSGLVPVNLLGAPVVDPADAGFVVTTSASTIPPGDAGITVTVTPPNFPPPQTGDGGTPAGSMPPDKTATLTLPSDATSQIGSIKLREKPLGASLKFDPSITAGFGEFAPIPIASSSKPPQSFGIVNNGSAGSTAVVTLSVTATAAPDAGAGASLDASAVAGAPSPFTLDNGVLTENFTVTQGGAQPQPTVTFTPVVAGGSWSQIAMSVDPTTTVLCAQLPRPLPLHGVGSGGGLSITTSSGTSTLSFPALCDGHTLPPTQSFIVKNFGDKSMEWSLSSITGPGAAQYQVTSVALVLSGAAGASTPLSTQPGVVGVLNPGDSATVTVGVKQAMPSAAGAGAPWTAPTPAALAAQLTVTTNVPGLSNSAVIALSEIPVGDQLFVSLGQALVPISSLDFGTVPAGTPSPPTRTFVVTNGANAGSADAKFSLGVTPATPSVYSVTGSSLAAGRSVVETITFTPAGDASYPATLQLTRTDSTAPLCAPLPAPVALTGTGTQGVPTVSAAPNGLSFGAVNCGTAAAPQSFTVTNKGHQAFNIKGLTLGKTTSSPFAVTTPPPIPVAAGQTVTITVQPQMIPAQLAHPGDVFDTSLFSDTLTIQTNAYPPGAGTQIPLSMQAQGAIIVDTTPALNTTWDFGTVSAGSIGTITKSIQNIGNLPATVSLGAVSPQVSSSVFSLASSPTTAPGTSVPGVAVTTPIVGQFTAPALVAGSWVVDETLSVTGALCGLLPSQNPLPAQWNNPTIHLSGASTSNPIVTASDSHISFPPTECGSPVPGPQFITLTNLTNQAYPVSATLVGMGSHYSVLITGNATSLPALGTVTIEVAPLPVNPAFRLILATGPAPYADNLLVKIGPPASPVETLNFPISWSLNGAVLSLQQSPKQTLGLQGQEFYLADSTSARPLTIVNSGNEAVSVVFQPSDTTFTVSPSPLLVSTLGAQAQLFNTSLAPPCVPPPTGPNTRLSFGYTACPACPTVPVCNPLPAFVQVLSCTGSYLPSP